jgi:1-acyl-sn-glycerol-3-phosphate acyltransferase
MINLLPGTDVKKVKIQRSRWSLIRLMCRFILKLSGWKTHLVPVDSPRYVLIGAYHTSNWDFVIGYLVMTAIGLNLNFVGKHTLFRWPLGPFMRWLGGIPVNRNVSTNFVDQVVANFRQYDELIVAIAPEGTRKKTENWKSGFYHIAVGAGVPIVLGFLDYAKKAGGLGAVIHPSGDIQHDLKEIRNFYSSVQARYPEKVGEIRVAPRKKS